MVKLRVSLQAASPLAVLLLLIFACNARAQVGQNAPAVGEGEQQQDRSNGGNVPALQGAAAGAEVESTRVVSFWLGHAESDNIGRTPAAVRGSYDTIGSTLDLSRRAERLQASVLGDAQFIHYSGDELEDEPVGTLGAFANVGIIPRRFTWSFQENYHQGRTNPFQAIGPENRESVNVLTSGPLLDLPLGGRNSLVMNSTFSRRTYQDSTNLDSDRIEGGLGIYRQIRRTARVGLAADSRKIEYDLDSLSYRIQSIGLRYEKTFRTGSMLVEGGQSELLFGDSHDKSPLLRVQWNRAVGTRSRFSLSGSKEITDPGELSQLTASRFLPERPTDVPLSSSAVTQRQVNALYEIALPRGSMALGYGTYRYIFEGASELNDDGTNATFAYTRAVTPLLDVKLSYSKLERQFVQTGLRNDETEIVASAVRRLGRHIDLGGSLTSYDHEGLDAFSETRFEMRVSYTPIR
jgi:hypothetical protein